VEKETRWNSGAPMTNENDHDHVQDADVADRIEPWRCPIGIPSKSHNLCSVGTCWWCLSDRVKAQSNAEPDSKLEELISRWEALKDGGGPSAPLGVLQDEFLTIISLARKGLTAPPHPDASAGLIEAADIAESLKSDAHLYTATEGGREGFVTACYEIAEKLRVRTDAKE
jgi:hypothetical protein